MSLFVNIQPVPFRLLDDLLAQMEGNNERLIARQGDKGGPTRPRPQRTVFNADASTYRRPEPAAHPRPKGLLVGWLLSTFTTGAPLTPVSGDGSTAGEPLIAPPPTTGANPYGPANSLAAQFITDWVPPTLTGTGEFDWDIVDGTTPGTAFYYRDRYCSSVEWFTSVSAAAYQSKGLTLPAPRGLIHAQYAHGARSTMHYHFTAGPGTFDGSGDGLGLNGRLKIREFVERRGDEDPYVTIEDPTSLKYLTVSLEDQSNITDLDWAYVGTSQVGRLNTSKAWNIGNKTVRSVSVPAALSSRLSGMFGSGDYSGAATFVTQSWPPEVVWINPVGISAVTGLGPQFMRLLSRMQPGTFEGKTYAAIDVVVQQHMKQPFTRPVVPSNSSPDVVGAGSSIAPFTSLGFVDESFPWFALNRVTPYVYRYMNAGGTFDPAGSTLPMGQTLPGVLSALAPTVKGLQFILTSADDPVFFTEGTTLEFSPYSNTVLNYDPSVPYTSGPFALTVAGSPRKITQRLVPLANRPIGGNLSSQLLVGTCYGEGSYCRSQLQALGFLPEEIA